MKLIKQSQKTYANKLKPGASIEISDTMVSDGGLLLAEHGGGKIVLKNVGSKGRVHGKGQYFVGIFNKPVDYFEWDNRDYLQDTAWWIRSSSGTKPGEQPGEAALRFESRVKKARIRGVKFRGGRWKNAKGVWDWWKESVQIRYTDDCEFSDCRFIGPTTFGKQDNDKLGQVVKLVTWKNCGFTHKPRMSKHRDSVKKFRFIGCYYIDDTGKPTGKKFADQTW